MDKLIINGDDFGMNERCTKAIARAFSEELITHTSMMANGAYFREAVRLMREEGFSDRVGLHFNLTEGEPLTEEIKRLPDFVSDGRFHKMYLKQPHPLNDAQQGVIYRELSAQALRLRQAGIVIPHADSHHYIHNLAPLAPIAARVCRENHIPRIRLNSTFDSPSHPRMTENRIPNAWWREQGFVTAAHFGRLSDVAGTAIPDNTEIMVHPDLDQNGNLIDRTGMTDGFPTGPTLGKLAELYR